LLQLEACNIPARAWEKSVLSMRVKNYIPDWLDNLCVTGKVSWLRLLTNKVSGKESNKKTHSRSNTIASTPIVIMPRGAITMWANTEQQASPPLINDPLSLKIFNILQQQGALFFADLVAISGLIRTQVEQALTDLVALGIISSDHFTGLRSLTTPANRRPKFGGRLGNPRNIEQAGRWWLLPHIKTSAAIHEPQTAQINQRNDYIARVLLRRYGVIFRKLLDRENHAPPWRDLLYCYRRMEARGEIRGGRFVQGFSGEQFALNEAAPLLSKIKNKQDERQIIVLSAADPLNLSGIITPGERITTSTKNRIVYVDGKPVAALINNDLQFFGTVDDKLIWAIQNQLFSHSVNSRVKPPRPSLPLIPH